MIRIDADHDFLCPQNTARTGEKADIWSLIHYETNARFRKQHVQKMSTVEIRMSR